MQEGKDKRVRGTSECRRERDKWVREGTRECRREINKWVREAREYKRERDKWVKWD